MKKYLPLLLVVCFFAFSCKKDHHPGTDPDAKTYNVKFNLAGFTQSITSATSHKKVNGIKTNATPVPVTNDYFKIIKYVVYDASGQEIRSLSIDSAASNFGSISDKLPAGTFTIGIVAGKSNLRISSNNGKPSKYQFYTYNSSKPNPISYAWQDTFFSKFTITVTGDINQAVTLSRVVAQLEVNIEDAIPANVKTIAVTVTNDYIYYSFNTDKPESPYLATFTTVVPDAEKGATNFKADNLICNTIDPFSVTITAYDANQKRVGISATVTNVTCEKNKKTILSGKLFSSPINDSFSIGFNDWDPTTTNYEF
jgi:hypothetical protein